MHASNTTENSTAAAAEPPVLQTNHHHHETAERSPLRDALHPGRFFHRLHPSQDHLPREPPSLRDVSLNEDQPVDGFRSAKHSRKSEPKTLRSDKALDARMHPRVTRSSSVPMRSAGGLAADGVVVDPAKLQRDELIMDTNKSSIVSKRSVEKMYAPGEPEYFRHFVAKFKRRSPLINRGYWLRMKAIEATVTRFLSERTAKAKIVVNLGCGYDPLPFVYLGKHPELCRNTTFVDVDYPILMQNKFGIINKSDELRKLLPKLTRTASDSGLLGSSDPYVCVGCDLTNLDILEEILRDHLQVTSGSVAILFVSEVSTAYMERDASQAVFQFTAKYDDVRFCLLEQHLPDGSDHPFAQTMLAHFEKIRTPLQAIGTMAQMKERFVSAGWPESGMEIRTLWELWSDPTFLSAEQRRGLDAVEPFDEWEEFSMFASHYFLLVAEKEPNHDYSHRAYRRASLMAGSSHMSIASSPSNSDTPEYHFNPGDILELHELLEPHDFRRYGAAVPPLDNSRDGDTVGLHAGMGAQERLDSTNTYSLDDSTPPIHGPPLRQGLMCHTITRLGSTPNCVLVGGRTSPEKPSAECWLRLDGKWRRVQDLPSGRYRHCAVPIVLPTEPRPAHTVLVFGGRTGDGHVLDEWLIWAGESGWQPVKCVGERPSARFGAAMITDSREDVSGVMVGGMTSAGRVLNEFWHWTLESDMTLICRNVTSRATAFLKADACILGRFGAQLVRSNRGILMIGGITSARMLTRQDEILNMRTLRPQPIQGPRPLFIGFSVQDVDGGLLCLGGGATCFSFGTTWNRSCILNDAKPDRFEMEWRLLTTQAAGEPTPEQRQILIEQQQSRARGNSVAGVKTPKPVRVQEIRISHGVNFPQFVEAARPLVLRECPLGPCREAWTSAYLKEAVGVDRPVSVHASQTAAMDFQNKNFTYTTQPFGAFLDAVDRGERLYLRSLSSSAPSERPTILSEDFPRLARDFELPSELSYVTQHAHSSPLRISGPVAMWLHYDVMANVLCQIRGSKRLLLFPPSDVGQLGFAPGASSSSLQVFAPTAAVDPALGGTHPHEALLEPGDVLFIPPMWIHTAAPVPSSNQPQTQTPSSAAAGGSGGAASVSVNIFFRSLPPNGYAAGRDVYGNRDLAAYENGRKAVERIVRSFGELPPEVAGFYLERLAGELGERGREVGRSGGLHSFLAELS